MTTPKKKLCWNCEGRVSLEEENCPYCAVYLGPAPDEKGTNRDNFNPPYRLVESEDEAAPQSPYGDESHEAESASEEQTSDFSTSKKDVKEWVLPLILLSAGTLFIIFGFVLFMFSEEGIFTLTWNSEYWYLYIAFAIPMLFIGWRLIQPSDD